MPYSYLNGQNLYFEQYGSGTPVLFIHGLGAGAWTWETQIKHFQKDFQVWVLEMRGHGRSDKPLTHYSIESFAEDITAFLRTKKLDVINLVGLSMGGIIAFEVARQNPQIVQSLTIVNSGPEVRTEDYMSRFLLWQRELFMHALSMEAISRILARRLFPEDQQAALREKFIKHWSNNDKNAYQSSFQAMVDWRGGALQSQIECPALFISTPNDYTSVEMKKKYINKMWDARLAVVENSRHVTPLDQPEAFNQVLQNFLAEITISEA